MNKYALLILFLLCFKSVICQNTDSFPVIIDTLPTENLGVIINTTSFGTDKFEITTTLTNNSDSTECIIIEKGVILTSTELLGYDYQSIVVCDVKNITATTSVTWRICLTSKKTITITLIGYCLNRKFKPPDNIVLTTTGFKLRKDKVQKACSCQDSLHKTVEENKKLLLENISTTGKSSNSDETQACKEAVNNAIKSLCENNLNVRNIISTDYKMTGICSFAYTDTIQVELQGLGVPDIALVNIKKVTKKVDEKNGDTEFSFTCDILPYPNYIRFFKKLLTH